MAPTSHRDFDARPQAAAPVSGSFTLGGRTWEIRSRAEVPYGLVRQLLGEDESTALGPDEIAQLPPEEQRSRARKLLLQTDEFFASTIVADQVEDFLAMVNDPAGPVSSDMPLELVQYISECLFSEAGPTKPSSNSSAGRRPTGSTSKAGSSSRVTPRSRSAV